MKINKLWLLIAIAAIGLVGLYAMPSDAAHPNVNLKAYDGSPAGGSIPYSPKLSCAGCHIDNCITTAQRTIVTNTKNWCETEAQRTALNSIADYEDGNVNVSKAHKHPQIVGALPASETTYIVPAPLHGASVGYHSQQGRNVPWNQSARNYYKLADFTSSPGMWGKY